MQASIKQEVVSSVSEQVWGFTLGRGSGPQGRAGLRQGAWGETPKQTPNRRTPSQPVAGPAGPRGPASGMGPDGEQGGELGGAQ